MAQPSCYEKNQHNSSEKILDDRPEPDADIASISLLYIFDGKTDVAGLSEVNVAKLQKAVDDFAQKMCRLYDNDDGQRTTALPALDCVLSARIGPKIPLLGAATSPGGGAPLVAVFKNRSAGNQAMAEVEPTAYVGRSHAMGVGEASRPF